MSKKIVQIVDTPEWAIEELCKPVRENNKRFEWSVLYVHPKALERGELDLAPIKKELMSADLIDAHYWRSLSQLVEKIPELKEKNILLTHHNEKNVGSAEWDYVNHFIAQTENNRKKLASKYGEKNVTVIPNSYDEKQFSYIEKLTTEKNVGYVGRIVPWKGLKEISRACYELGYTLLFMGKHDKVNYFNEIPKEHREIIDWSYMNCNRDDRYDFYKNIQVYVGYSGSGRETGPLGLIEAMSSGIPVVTTPAGIAADICEDRENALVIDFNDYEGLKHQLQDLMESESLKQRIRLNGWNDIRNRNHTRRSLEYRKVFNKMLYDKPLVSVIIPATKEVDDDIKKIREAFDNQTYSSIEVIVVYDNNEGYNLARARNEGVIEASGEYIMFCDSRLLPDKNTVKKFVWYMENAKEKTWLFGNKGGAGKPHFVENFSFIKRKDLIGGGMMNERITGYGGMSQELRERFAYQGFEFMYCDDVTASELRSGRKDNERRKQIVDMKNLLYKMYE